MEGLGLNAGVLVAQVLNVLILLVWLGGMLISLYSLSRRDVPPTARVLWAALIVVVPVLGMIAFWIAGPPRRAPDPGSSR
jgi:hypothetical protein